MYKPCIISSIAYSSMAQIKILPGFINHVMADLCIIIVSTHQAVKACSHARRESLTAHHSSSRVRSRRSDLAMPWRALTLGWRLLSLLLGREGDLPEHNIVFVTPIWSVWIKFSSRLCNRLCLLIVAIRHSICLAKRLLITPSSSSGAILLFLHSC